MLLLPTTAAETSAAGLLQLLLQLEQRLQLVLLLLLQLVLLLQLPQLLLPLLLLQLLQLLQLLNLRFHHPIFVPYISSSLLSSSLHICFILSNARRHPRTSTTPNAPAIQSVIYKTLA